MAQQLKQSTSKCKPGHSISKQKGKRLLSATEYCKPVFFFSLKKLKTSIENREKLKYKTAFATMRDS